MLLERPHLYRLNRGNGLMSKRQTLKWFLEGLWHAAVSFYGTYFLWDSMQQGSGKKARLNAVWGL